MLRTIMLLLSFATIGQAIAEPRFARFYKQQYGYTPACDACHTDGGGTRLNAYGEQFKRAGAGLAAFAAIGDQDADEDGSANRQEIEAKANPGQRRSTPKNPGNWLDTAQLIPQAVQQAFPGVTTYKPLDTLLTDADIARAAQLGATLSSQDDTTLYVAVDDGKAVGTALIVPARFQDQPFYVLLATDRQLRVSVASAMHVGEVEQAADPALYQAALGVPVDQLAAANGDGSLADAVRGALKVAGSLLYVRLKSQ